MVKRLFKIQNLNASTIRTVMVADCSRFDNPDLLLDAGDQAVPPCRVFDLGCDSEDEAASAALRAPGRAKEGLRRALDGMLDGHTQLSERALETRVAELLAQGRTKPPERSAANARNKYLIFTTGCLTYSPHQIGNVGQSQHRRTCSTHCPAARAHSPKSLLSLCSGLQAWHTWSQRPSGKDAMGQGGFRSGPWVLWVGVPWGPPCRLCVPQASSRYCRTR